jgi:GNAT superfamily N-acetyltransferase
MAGSSVVRLRPAQAVEAVALGELCLRSKAVWGYDAAFLAACREELQPKAEAIAQGCVQVATMDQTLAGVAEVSIEGETAHLEKLFVEPRFIGDGVGGRLMDWAVAQAASLGATRIVIESDPGAAGFYRRRGALDDGVAPSGSIPGRFLPRLVLAVAGFETAGQM